MPYLDIKSYTTKISLPKTKIRILATMTTLTIGNLAKMRSSQDIGWLTIRNEVQSGHTLFKDSMLHIQHKFKDRLIINIKFYL